MEVYKHTAEKSSRGHLSFVSCNIIRLFPGEYLANSTTGSNCVLLMVGLVDDPTCRFCEMDEETVERLSVSDDFGDVGSSTRVYTFPDLGMIWKILIERLLFFIHLTRSLSTIFR